MSGGVAKPLRARAEAILCDNYGDAGHVIASDHFHRSGVVIDAQASAERRVTVAIGARVNTDGVVNDLDGFVLGDYPLTVTIAYARAHGGGDLAEALGEQDGSATDEDILDRMTTDQHLIEQAIHWYGNWAGLDPAVWNVRTDNAPDQNLEGDIATLVINFTLQTRATNPGTYQP